MAKETGHVGLGKALFGERSFGVVSDFGCFPLRIN